MVEGAHHIAEGLRPVSLEVFPALPESRRCALAVAVAHNRDIIAKRLKNIGKTLRHRGSYRRVAVFHIFLKGLEKDIVGPHQRLHIPAHTFVEILVHV